MKALEEHYAAMAAALIDEELAWRLNRLPLPGGQKRMEDALLSEAERRGLALPGARWLAKDQPDHQRGEEEAGGQRRYGG